MRVFPVYRKFLTDIENKSQRPPIDKLNNAFQFDNPKKKFSTTIHSKHPICTVHIQGEGGYKFLDKNDTLFDVFDSIHEITELSLFKLTPFLGANVLDQCIKE